jgi:hypothetical protein
MFLKENKKKAVENVRRKISALKNLDSGDHPSIPDILDGLAASQQLFAEVHKEQKAVRIFDFADKSKKLFIHHLFLLNFSAF